MNASLRLAGGAKLPGWMTEHLEGNRYVNTIYLCASGMLKFSAVSRIPKGRKVYRGIAGVRLPGLFVLVGVDGSRGGVEFAFMSTTTNMVGGVIRGYACVSTSSASPSSAPPSSASPSSFCVTLRPSHLHLITIIASPCMCLRERAQDVSVEYIDAEKGLPILFEFDVGAIDRGCPLSFLSQFPGEDEILIPPFSYLEVTGAPFSMDTEKGVVTVYPARINCNLKARTIDQIESSRRDELLAQHPYLVAEFERDVPAVKEMLEKKKPVVSGNSNSKWELEGIILPAGRRQLEDLGKTLRAKEAAWYLLYCLRVCPRPTPSFLSVGLCWLAVCGGV